MYVHRRTHIPFSIAQNIVLNKNKASDCRCINADIYASNSCLLPVRSHGFRREDASMRYRRHPISDSIQLRYKIHPILLYLSFESFSNAVRSHKIQERGVIHSAKKERLLSAAIHNPPKLASRLLWKL